MAQLLLVEDDVLLGQAVKSALEQDGHAVALAHNAAQAQKLWQAVRFDLCLLDVCPTEAAWTCVPGSGRHGTPPTSFSPPTTPMRTWSGDSKWAVTTM